MGLHLAGGQSPGLNFRARFLSVLWMQGWKASSASFLMILDWEMLLTNWRFERLCRDLDRLNNWTIIIVLKFDNGKCYVFHLGCSNAGYKYRLGNEWLKSGSAERCVEALVRLNVTHQFTQAARRENYTECCIKHSIASW